MIFTTHDLSIAIREADKLWLLSRDGFYHGSPEDLILGGIVSKTFNTPNVSFDNRKGDFTIKKKLKPFLIFRGRVILFIGLKMRLKRTDLPPWKRKPMRLHT
ncbi:MAG: hypothetical protein HC830_15125 [Bacteroidetes bacterium]|nr:hypothetical protein [Bacteroidota bacterium]